MHPAEELRRALARIDGRGYPAYREIAGSYDFGDFHLHIDHVQGDPYAAPSKLRASVPLARAGIPAELFSNRVRRIALEDLLTRAFADAIARVSRGTRGTGGSGRLAIDRPGQEVLERTSMRIAEGVVEARFVAGLPAAGRRILGREAISLCFEEIPAIVRRAMFYANLDGRLARRWIELAEDQERLRAWLRERDLVAFVGRGAILPRESGVSDRPLQGDRAIPFEPPPSLTVEVDLPHAGRIAGLGIPSGVTLIVGGGYHGKSTLLRALERGVYNHVPGDGREYVITRADAVKIRSEDGRRAEKVDIHPFIDRLPQGIDTRSFSTEQASGSTSQAVNIMEAIEVGARVLLLDEDTSATNFMVRDRRMQALVAKEREPITPFVDQVRRLHRDRGVSTVLVIGGSGDYLDVADTVIRMDAYRPFDATEEAQRVAAALPTGRVGEGERSFPPAIRRRPLPETFRGLEGGRVKSHGLHSIQFGDQTVDLGHLDQLVDPSQTRAIAALWLHASRRGYVDGKASLREVLQRVFSDIDEGGLDALSPFRGQHPGEYARPRVFEAAAVLNRLGSLRVAE